MKILVVSDTHGHEENLKRVLAQEGMPDYLLHLGDSQSGETAIRNLVTCPVHMVVGNCDFFLDLPRVKIVEIGPLRILMTHGHYYYVSVGTRDLSAEAKTNGCNVAMFGHTHKPFVDQKDPELTVLNPGSLSFPRQEGKAPSYAMVEITDGQARYEVRYLE